MRGPDVASRRGRAQPPAREPCSARRCAAERAPMPTPTSARTVSASIARKLEKLPVLPSDFGEMIGLDPAADDFGKRVEGIAMREPALAAKLLSVANAALLGSQSTIRTLDVAIVRMGSRRVAALVTSFAAMRVFKPTTEAQRDLWRHALSCAVGA